ncbi:DNA photolyase [Loktanella sp. S4079]|nr:DNA photolyase [Loktanella sp. S4079]
MLEPEQHVDFIPTRAAGLRRLDQFAARAGRHYASFRNYDFGCNQRHNVSELSPWLRHRLITEEEVLTRVLAAHCVKGAEKFIQEVFWRTYFKGWLEQHPSVWESYQQNLRRWMVQLADDANLRANYRDAVSGQTGIDCFDHWVHELTDTGYLHNHARMWMASIWIFTLRLPWELGADLFLRHLLDGDPASNTLSWRWVAGLHTKGKTYLARPDNIAKYTNGRFHPNGLATMAEPLMETCNHPCVAIPSPQAAPTGDYLLLLHKDDVCGVDVMSSSPAGAIGLMETRRRSTHSSGHIASAFTKGALDTALAPFEGDMRLADDWSTVLIEAAQRVGVTMIATAYPPIGMARTLLDEAAPKLRDAGISLCRVIRPYDQISWPYAKAGFFGLKKKIPTILRDLNLSAKLNSDGR